MEISNPFRESDIVQDKGGEMGMVVEIVDETTLRVQYPGYPNPATYRCDQVILIDRDEDPEACE